ncbi:hypothetical protein TrLO_g13207 [Triparma laevis f. longispina]|uniref:Uncharacterized protein n=1 Tax=Triparma laevis f. longispina TaxID=1714387 RepID=A0A9W7F8B2_9STRA|nr:hypothetical protein TrLO_g13207 [Triparma laevis f. longispina]
MSHLSSLKSTLSSLTDVENTAPTVTETRDVIAKSSMCKVAYNTSRNKYLTQRVEEQMLDYVSTYDVSTNEFQSPSAVESNDEEGDKLIDDVVKVAKEICMIQSDLDARRGKFEEGRNELEKVVSEMDEDDQEEVEGDDFTEGAEEKIEEEIKEMEGKREEMKRKLKEVQEKIGEEQASLAESMATIKEGGGGDPEDVIKTAKPTSDVIKEASKLKAALIKTSETSQWYEAVRAAMEQLSGIKVEGIEAIKKGKSQTGMMVKLLCGREGNHELNIILKAAKGGMKVDDAVLKGERISDEFGIITCGMPTLTDLVAASAGMKAPNDLRFVIREASARLRNSVLKTSHVGKLRKRFEVKSSGERLDNLIVNVSEGVQANIRLTLDYPTCAGSCYIDNLQSATLPSEELEKLRESVNEKRIEHVLGLVEELVKGVREVALLGVGNTLGLGELPR